MNKTAIAQATQRAKDLIAAGFDVVPSDLVLTVPGLSVYDAKAVIAKVLAA